MNESLSPNLPGLAGLVLAIDIGNTQTGFGLFQHGQLAWTIHLSTDANRPAAEIEAWLARELADREIQPGLIAHCAIASVVPAAVPSVMAAVRNLTGLQPLLADRHNIGLEMAVEAPDRVGIDRIVNARAAKLRYPCPIIIIDLGTATTISVVDSQGRFAGGTISPGLQTAANALHRSTAQLPVLDMTALAARSAQGKLVVPVIGKDTEACIRSGLIQGTAAMLEGLIDRIEDELGQPASRVITGGLGRLVRQACRRVLHDEPHLLLNGLHEMALAADNRSASEPVTDTFMPADRIGRLGIIGAGRVGVTLGACFASRGLCLAGYYSLGSHSASQAARITGTRHLDSLADLVNDCDCLLLTVPDDQVAAVWTNLKKSCRPGQWVMHCSGSLGSDVFTGSRVDQVKVASMHPMQAFSRRDGSFAGLGDACFSLEGDPEVTAAWQSFLHQAGHPVLMLDASQKTRVHLASVLVANLGLALASLGSSSLQQLGLPASEASRAILPLLQSNLDNLRHFGLPEAITGPIDRNDPGTVARHLAILPEEQLPVYRILSRQLLQLARQKHPDRNYDQLGQLLADPATSGKRSIE